MSADVATVEVMVDELLPRTGSAVVLLTLAVLTMDEPPASLALACTTMVKVALAPAFNAARVPVTVPVPPAGGLLNVNAGPVVCDSETKVVPVGTASVNRTDWALLGPVLLTVIV